MAVHLPFEAPRAVPPTSPFRTAHRSTRPVFVDLTGVRRRRVRRAGLLVAAASLTYLPMVASGLLPGPAVPAQARPPAATHAPTGTDDRPEAVPSPVDSRYVEGISGTEYRLNDGSDDRPPALPPDADPTDTGPAARPPASPPASPRTSPTPSGSPARTGLPLPSLSAVVPALPGPVVTPFPTTTAPAAPGAGGAG